MVTYRQPGVYVEGSAPSLVAPGGVPATTVTLVGPSRGYQVATETIALGDAVVLANKGVLPDANPAPNLVVTALDGSVLVESDPDADPPVAGDYTLVRGAGAGDSTTITRDGDSSSVDAGTLVRVSYAYADANYYAPKNFVDFTSIESTYGPAMVTTIPGNPDGSQVSSPLSLAARLAFENGATAVLCVATEPPTNEYPTAKRFEQALTKLSGNPNVTLVVPVLAQGDTQTDDAYTGALAGLIAKVRVHVETESNAGYGRIAFVGADRGYDVAGENADFNEIAEAVHSRRVVLAYPHRMAYYNDNLSQTTEVGGCYLAAAYAGRLAAQSTARGLTRLQVFGFTGIPADVAAEMSMSFKNLLSGAGVAVTEYGRNNALQVRHGVSTDMSDILTQEVSITRAQDVLYRLVADGIDNAGLIGEAIDADMPMRVKGILTGILEGAQADEVIAEWVDLQVRQQSSPTGNPTVIECLFTYRPFLPLNYITVAFSLDLATGTVSSADDIDVVA